MKLNWLVIRKNFKICLLASLISMFLPYKLFGQKNQLKEGTYYQKIFQGRYNDALRFIDDNSWISDSLEKNGINPAFATAIVFPELIRYSSIKDKMELGGLLTLYVQYGEKYADFSVGRFQMKPTFAEQLEKDANRYFPLINVNFNKTITPEARVERIKRLNSINWQLNYLMLFIKIMEKRYAHIPWLSEEEKLQYYATAYNTGYTLPFDRIKENINYNQYYIGLVKPECCYNYADIALDYYRKMVFIFPSI